MSNISLTLKVPLFFISLVFSAVVNSSSLVKTEPDKYLGYLKAENFSALNVELMRLITQYQSDFHVEQELDLALEQVSASDPLLEEKLTKWVDEIPNSVAAHLVRGSYYANVAWTKRGTRFYSQTTQKQIDGMQYYFQKAYADLEEAKSLDPNLVHARIYEMDVFKSYGEHERIKALKDEALKLNPYSYTARRDYIWTVTPRWGGSMAQIEEEVKAARPYYDKNPRLKLLEAELYRELGQQALTANQNKQAFEYFSKALDYEVSGYNYDKRGYALARLGDFASALQDFDKAVGMSPFYSEAYANRGGAKYNLKDYQGAIEDYSKALSFDPENADILSFRGECYLLIGDPESALADLQKAVTLFPGNKRYKDGLEKAMKAISPAQS